MTTWTEERDAQLEKMRELGLTFSQIAAAFGMTSSAVIGRADRLGLAKQGQPATRSPKRRAILKLNAPHPVPAVQPAPLPIGFVAPIALFDLEPHHCRWPLQDWPNYMFCGGTKIGGSSYCEHHRVVSKRGVADRS